MAALAHAADDHPAGDALEKLECARERAAVAIEAAGDRHDSVGLELEDVPRSREVVTFGNRLGLRFRHAALVSTGSLGIDRRSQSWCAGIPPTQTVGSIAAITHPTARPTTRGPAKSMPIAPQKCNAAKTLTKSMINARKCRLRASRRDRARPGSAGSGSTPPPIRAALRGRASRRACP